jgi:Kazal-type serine protease inhibitor domain
MYLRISFIILFFLSLMNIYAQDPNSASNPDTNKSSGDSSKDCIDQAKRNSKVRIACSAPIDPVCGCDGVTYDNVCRAENAGVKRFVKGACDKKGGDAVTNDDCKGKAVKKTCTSLFEPVCGCDGQTYSNACIAEAKGIKKFTKGECGKKEDPAPSDDCKGKAINKTCTSLFEPVCGCDNQTYSNACVAEAAGVKRFKKGECGKKADDSNGGWNNSNGSTTSPSGETSNKSVVKNMNGCGGIWDHIKNWEKQNGAAKVSFEIIPNDPQFVQVKDVKKAGGGKVLDVKVLDNKKLLKTFPLIVNQSNIQLHEIKIDDVKVDSSSQDDISTGLNKIFKGNSVVLNAENNEFMVKDKNGKVLFYTFLDAHQGKNDFWGKIELNRKSYLVKLNWTKGEIVQNTTFNEIK